MPRPVQRNARGRAVSAGPRRWLAVVVVASPGGRGRRGPAGVAGGARARWGWPLASPDAGIHSAPILARGGGDRASRGLPGGLKSDGEPVTKRLLGGASAGGRIHLRMGWDEGSNGRRKPGTGDGSRRPSTQCTTSAPDRGASLPPSAAGIAAPAAAFCKNKT